MADPAKKLPDLPGLDETFHLLCRDFAELVADGVLQDSPEAAEDFIGGYLWFEGLRQQRRE